MTLDYTVTLDVELAVTVDWDGMVDHTRLATPPDELTRRILAAVNPDTLQQAVLDELQCRSMEEL